MAYSNEARVVLPLTPASQGGVIEAALYPLAPNGSTNAEAGLKLGYEVALAGLDAGKNHRVVFLSDGVANVGQTDQDRIAADPRPVPRPPAFPDKSSSDNRPATKGSGRPSRSAERVDKKN